MANEKRNKQFIDGTILRICTGIIGGNESPAIIVDVDSAHGPAQCTLWLTQAAIQGTAERMRQLGQPAGTGIVWVDDNPLGLTGNTVRLCYYEEEYKGEWSTKCDIVGESRAKPLNTAQRSVVDDLFKAASAMVQTPFDGGEDDTQV